MDQPDPGFDTKLHRLNDSLNRLKDTLPKPVAKRDTSESSAVRMVSDFAAAAVVGSAAGYGLDAWLGTAPWLLIVGLLLGTGAGTKLLIDFEKRQK